MHFWRSPRIRHKQGSRLALKLSSPVLTQNTLIVTLRLILLDSNTILRLESEKLKEDKLTVMEERFNNMRSMIEKVIAGQSKAAVRKVRGRHKSWGVVHINDQPLSIKDSLYLCLARGTNCSFSIPYHRVSQSRYRYQLPIASNESYKFDYNSKTWVILEFLKDK